MDPEDLKVVHREVLRNKGELLFAKAIILFEGITEEQLFPAMFEIYFDASPFERGVTLMSVGGKNYPPFIKLALSFGIPVFIVGDNDKTAKTEVESQISKLMKLASLKLDPDTFGMSFLSTGNDIEAELINVLNLKGEIISALVKAETRGSENPKYIAAKATEISALHNGDIILRMRNSKSSYSGYLPEVLIENPNKRKIEDRIPKALLDAFVTIKGWL